MASAATFRRAGRVARKLQRAIMRMRGSAALATLISESVKRYGGLRRCVEKMMRVWRGGSNSVKTRKKRSFQRSLSPTFSERRGTKRLEITKFFVPGLKITYHREN